MEKHINPYSHFFGSENIIERTSLKSLKFSTTMDTKVHYHILATLNQPRLQFKSSTNPIKSLSHFSSMKLLQAVSHCRFYLESWFMSHLTGIFTKKYILVLTQYQPSGTFQLGMPHIPSFCFFFFSINKSRKKSQKYTQIGTFSKIGTCVDKSAQLATL